MSLAQENIARFYSKLNALRAEEKFTDVALQCESRTFKCHRLILTIASPYFEAMFESGFKESTLGSIVLKEVSATTFEEVLHFIYTGDVTVNAANVCDLLRMSDYFSLPGIEVVCLEFVAINANTHQMTIQNLFNLFLYTLNTKKNDFVSILSVLIAEHFSVCCKFQEFLEISFDHLQIILNQYLSLSSRNEEVLLSAIIRWTGHNREERLQRLHEFFGMIRFFSISPGYYLNLITEMLIAGQEPVTVLTKPAGCDTVQELQEDRILKTENGLHVFVGYRKEDLMRTFSVNSANECTYSGAISINPPGTLVKCVVSDDLYLYCLNYVLGIPKEINCEKQKFCAYTSVDRQVALKLTPPPCMIGSVTLCYLQNNIYVYDDDVGRYSIVRTNSTSGKMFNDEEIKRGIFVYNCSSDSWFPVPQMKKLLVYSCMTVCENILYFIGGSESCSQYPGGCYAQAFDFRSGWRMLPASHNLYFSASCCSLNGRIYVCGGMYNEKRIERYDPIASKWETIPSMDNGAIYHCMIPFDNKLWVMGNYYHNKEQNKYFPSNDLSMNVYDVAVNQWSESSILTKAAGALNPENDGIISDGVVFSIL